MTALTPQEAGTGLYTAQIVKDGQVATRDVRVGIHTRFVAQVLSGFRPGDTAPTLLGIIIGTASVIALMAIGEGSQQTVLDQLAVFGTNRLYVNPGNESGRGPGGTLSSGDADLVRDVPNVAAAMPYLQGQVTVRYGNIDACTTATAVTTDYPRILNWPLGEGVFFTKEDERDLATVAVIGRKVARALFPDGADPVARFILINNVPFQVIGVLSEKGAISGDADDDDTIAIPFETGSQRIFGTPNLSWISVPAIVWPSRRTISAMPARSCVSSRRVPATGRRSLARSPSSGRWSQPRKPPSRRSPRPRPRR